MAESATETVTFLFTDVEGSTRLLERFPAAIGAALQQHFTLLQQAVAAQGGRVFETVGDAAYVAFPDAAAAITAAVQGQLALQAARWGVTGPLRVRMALHVGEVERRGTHYFGAALFRCARLQALAAGGQILISGATAARARAALPPGVSLRELGTHRLKDLAQPEVVWQVLHPGLADEFPPLRSANGHVYRLPAPTTTFVGRQAERAALLERLRRPDARLLTLVGPAGVGKSRLALQAATDLAEAFPRGALLVDLTSLTDPAQVLGRVATALGSADVPPQRALEAVREAVRDQPLLLVLDGFEHLLAATADLAALLAVCPRLKLLVTSRAPLHLADERQVDVAPLDTPDPRQPLTLSALLEYDAVRLFVERARAARADFALTAEHAAAIAAICARLEGLPLALELAAARVKLLDPRELLARLDDRLALLSGGARHLPPRQRTLRGAIDWSCELLAPSEQRLFRRMAVFAGGFTLDAAEAVCGALPDPELDLLDGLTTLVEQSLLRQEALEAAAGRPAGPRPAGDPAAPRFRMLETVRAFALERLEQSGEAAPLREAHARYFLALTERALRGLRRRDQGNWLRRLEQEQENLALAQRWAAARHDDEADLRLGLSAVLGGGRRRRGVPTGPGSAGAPGRPPLPTPEP